MEVEVVFIVDKKRLKFILLKRSITIRRNYFFED